MVKRDSDVAEEESAVGRCGANRKQAWMKIVPFLTLLAVLMVGYWDHGLVTAVTSS